MIHGEIAELKRNLASRAMPFLLSEKQVFVCPVAGQFAKVRPSWNVGSANRLEVVKQVDFLTDADLHKVGRFLGYVDADPLTVEPFGGNTGGGATGEGVQDHVALVAAGLDDSV